jgi:rod shape-determining protein MreC
MQPSRDDFVIAIRSAFLQKGTKQRFSLIALLFFSITLIVLGKYNFVGINYLKVIINEVVYRSSYIVSVPEKYATQSYNTIRDHIILYKDYDILKKKLKKIESQKYNIDFLIAENKKLKKTLEDVSYSSHEQLAKVLIDKESPFLRSIIINKGTKHNITKGMTVLNDNYLVGKVVEVNFSTARVLLLSDLNSKTPVTIEPGSVQAILSGTGKNSGIIQYSKENLPINAGSIVFTSGAGGLFKEGIPVGKITEINNKKVINFFSDFSQLGFVKVVLYSKEKN